MLIRRTRRPGGRRGRPGAGVQRSRRGALHGAFVTDDTQPGQVVIEGIWWHKFHPGGRGVNVLTTDRLADMGGGPAFHSNMVEVEKEQGS